MTDQIYTASKSRSQQRSSWAVAFRHPLRTDARGKPGLKMRRGLGTSDPVEADRMVAELNELLADPSWWSATRRAEAAGRFSSSIVDAFFDEIQAGIDDPAKLRERSLPLPGRDQGYARVQFIGTTGAGKTSLLRQFIGSDPDEDRFPSTAPAKTTIADIEVIQSDGDFEAIVTFWTEFQVQASIEECVADACAAVIEQGSDAKVIDRLLNHRDQRFRLSYTLGPWRQAPEPGSEDTEDWSFEETAANVDAASENGPPATRVDAIPAEERAALHVTLESFLERIRALATDAVQEISTPLGVDFGALSPDDRDAAFELFDEQVYKHAEFSELVQDVLDAVRSRFDRITAGDLVRAHSGWPRAWTLKTADRAEFIRQIRWFSSNYWPEFGRLLTPLVDGIRVRGPLYPSFSADQPKLVLIDGQGLGHSPDSTSSVTTHITRRLGDVDVVLLVDNAKQPMQAAPLAVLRYLASSGHYAKLALAFSHFDHIKGANLKSPADRRAHVMASVFNAITSLRPDVGGPVVAALERNIEHRCFMLGGVDRLVTALPARAADYMREQLSGLLALFAEAVVPPPLPDACPIYDPIGLAFAVREAVTRFMGPWTARLGLGTHGQIRREHWTRIKALTRRIAGELDVEYDNLRPVAELVGRMSEAISRFLDNPIAWTRQPANDAEAETSVSRIRQDVAAALHDLCHERVINKPLSEWRTAFNASGKGSGSRRAHTVSKIYEAAAPLPDAVMTQATSAFVIDVRRAVTEAIERNGGQVELAPVK
jgi:hypothetical protein